MTFEEELRVFLREARDKTMKAYDKYVEDLANVKSGTQVYETAHRADRWRRAAEMSEKANKRLRAEVQDLTKQLKETKQEKDGLEGKLRKAEERSSRAG